MSLSTRTKGIFLLKNIDAILTTKNNKVVIYLWAFVFCTLFLFAPSVSHAATLYWVGDAGANTSVASNWKTTDPTTCGSGNSAAAPVAADTIIFDAECDNGANIDSTLSVATFQINTGYDGTITQAADVTAATLFSQSAGTFTGDTHTLSVKAFTHTAGGTFTAPTNTVFIGTGGTYNATADTFNNININKTTGNTLTITAGQTMVVTGTLTLSDGSVSTGTIDARGVINQASTFDGGSANLDFGDNAVAQTYTSEGGTGPVLRFNNASDVNDSIVMNAAATLYGISITVDFGANAVPITYNGNNLTVGAGGYSQAAGTFTPSSLITFAGNFAKTGGEFVEGTGTVIFGGSTNYTINVDATETFYNVQINKSVAGYDTDLTTGDTLVVSGDLSLIEGGMDTGTLDLRGNITQASTFDGGTTTVDFGNDSVAQTYTANGGVGLGIRFNSAADANDSVVLGADTTLFAVTIEAGFGANNVPINYNSHNLTLGFGGVSPVGGYSQAVGTFTAPSLLTIRGSYFTKTGGTFEEGSGTVLFDGWQTTFNVDTTETLNNVTFSQDYDFTVSTGDIMVVSGELILAGGDVNGGTIDTRGNIRQTTTAGAGNTRLDFGNNNVAQTYTIEGGVGPVLRFDDPADVNDSVVFNADGQLFGLIISSGFGNNTVPLAYNGHNLAIGPTGNSAGIFTQEAGTFISPAVLSIGTTDWVKTGGTFDPNNGTVRIFDWGSYGQTINVDSSITLNNLTIDKGENFPHDIATGDTIVVEGTLTLKTGYFRGGTLDARGDVILYTTYGATTSQSKILFSGSNTQTFTTNNSATLDSDITVNKTGGQVNLVGDLTMNATNQDLTIQQGTFDLNGQTLIVNGTTGKLIVNNTGNLQMQGAETITALTNYPQIDTGSTVTYDGTSGPYTLKDYTYSNLVINGSGATFSLPGAKNVANLTITAGTLDVTASNHALSVSGNWSNSGTFTPQAGTVTFNGTAAGKTISGTTTFNNVTVNGAAGGWTVDTGTTTIGGVLTLTDGALTNDATVNLTGTGTTVSIASGKTFTNNSTVNLGGTAFTLTGTWTNAANSTVTLTGVADDTAVVIPNIAYGNFQINNSGTTFTPTGALTINGNVTLTAGTLDVDNTNNYGITVAGNWTDTASGDNFIERAGTVTFTNDGTVNANEPFYHIILNGSGKTLTLGGNLDINGNLTLSAGTLDQSGTNYNINLAGNLTNNATLNGRAGTVTLDGGDQQLLGSSDTTFYNLTKQVSSPQTLTFKNGRTITVTHTATLSGTEGNLLSLRSDSNGVQWKLDSQGTRVIQYVDVKDSNNLNATVVTCDIGCFNSRNNTNWLFPVQGIAYALDGTTPLASKTIGLSINGATPITATTNGSGAFSINPGNINDGDVLTVFLKSNPSHKGVTVTITDGTTTNALHITQDSLIVRNEATGPISVATLDTANNSNDDDINAIYTLDGTGNAVLVTDKNLIVGASSTFTPGKNVSINNISIIGTFVPEANTVNVSGSWLNTGTFTKGTSTVNFTGTSTKTLTSGGSAFNNVTLNGSDLRLNLQDNLTVNGALIITQGNLDLNSYDLINTGGTFSSSGTLTLQGSETFTNFTNDSDSGTTVFDGTGTYLTVPLNSFYHLTFNGVGGVWTLNQNISANGNVVLSAGTVNGGTRTVTVAGSWTDATDLFSQDTSTLKLTGTGTLNESGNLYNLNVDSSGTVTMASVLNINNNLTITAGTLDVSAGNFAINLTGNWNNVTGTFNPRAGTVSLIGTNQSVSGDNTFYNLTKETGDATLTFENNKTQTIQNTWTAKGTNGHNILLRSASEGSQWRVSPANYVLQYVDIKDSNNTSGVTIIAANDASNSGNNTGWAFPLVVTVYSDKGVTKIGQNKTVSVSVNGGAKVTNSTTADSTALFNDGTANHTISVASGDVVTMWLDGNTEKGATVTITNGTTLSFNIFQDFLTVEHETGSQITNANLDTANNVVSSELDAVYTVQNSNLTLASGKSLYVKAGSTYIPGGEVTAHDFIISGTFTMGTNDVSVGGSWDATGGTFTGTNTVTFTSTAPEFITSNNNAFNDVSFEANSDADTGRWTTTDKFVVNGTNTMSIASPADVPDTTDPSISSILATAADTSASISWTTNESADSKLEYGTTASLGTEITDTTMTLRHSITLTSLSPSTTYRYRITSKDPSNNDVVSDIGTFTTLAAGLVLDTTAPSITATTTSDTSATTVTVNWTTNEDTVGYIDYGTTTTYNRGANPGTSTYQVNQSAVLTGLTANTTYHYRVVVIDAAGNMTKGEDKTLETSAATDTADTTAPAISNISSASLTSSGATITWGTNEESTASLDYGESSSYNRGATSGTGDKTGKDFSVTLSGLSPATIYHYRVVAIDASGNKALSDDHTFLTLPDEASAKAAEVLAEAGSRSSSDAPKLSSDAPSVSDISGNQVTVSWKTDKKSTSVVYYRELNTTTDPLKQGDASYVQNHQLTLSGLKEATTYEYSVESKDPEGSTMQSKRYEFTTRLPKVKDITVQNLNDAMAKFVYTTENPTATVLELRDVLTGETINIQDDSVVMEHKVTLDNLNPDTEYSAVVLIKGNNNDVKRSMAYIFRTLPDTANPIVSAIETRSAIVEGEKDKVQTIITWNTDEPSTSQIEYNEGLTKGGEFKHKTPEQTDLVTKHVIVLAELSPSTVYEYRVKSNDRAKHSTKSDARVLLTPQRRVSAFDLIIRNLEDTFGWTKAIGG